MALPPARSRRHKNTDVKPAVNMNITLWGGSRTSGIVPRRQLPIDDIKPGSYAVSLSHEASTR
jgi:hypothetical protein